MPVPRRSRSPLAGGRNGLAMGYAVWVWKVCKGKFRTRGRVLPGMAGAVGIRLILNTLALLELWLILSASPRVAADHEAL